MMARFTVMAPAAFVIAALAPASLRAQTPAAPPAAKAAAQSETLVLRWIKPSEFVRQLTPPDLNGDSVSLAPGLTRLSPDDAKGRILVQGSEKALAQLHEIVPLLDVEPRQVSLTARILRVPAGTTVSIDPAAPRLRGIVVTTAQAKARNNERVTLYAVGDGKLFHVELAPHVNGDRTVTITMAVSDGSQSAPSGGEASAVPAKIKSETRRTQSGTPLVASLLPVSGLNNTQYYLEVTTVVLDHPSDTQTAQIVQRKQPQ